MLRAGWIVFRIDWRNSADIDRDGPAITLNDHLWAYCSRGGLTDHVWQRIAPTTLDEIAISSHTNHRRTPVAI